MCFQELEMQQMGILLTFIESSIPYIPFFPLSCEFEIFKAKVGRWGRNRLELSGRQEVDHPTCNAPSLIPDIKADIQFINNF